MENKHTAEKWEVSKETNGLFVHAKTGDTGLNDAICLIYTDKPNFHADKAEANAKLIAAAPILYNAAYSALQAIYAMPKKKQAFYQYLINDLLNAIQKANGTII